MSKKDLDFLPIDFILNRKRDIVSLTPSLDILTGGGVSSGTWNVLIGPEKTGKTALLLHFAAKAQKQGRNVYYANVEDRLSKRDLLSVKDLDHDKFFVIGSSPEEKNEEGEVVKEAKILSGEEYLEKCMKAMKDDKGCVVLLDSESFLVCADEQTEGFDKMFRADGAKLFTKFAKKIRSILSTNDNILWVVRHVQANVSGYGASLIEKGARAGNYAVDLKLFVRKSEKWIVQEKVIGLQNTWELITGFLDGAMPGSKIGTNFRYNGSFDESADIAQMAIDFGVAPMKGPWITYKDNKYQGLENFVTSLKEDSKKRNELFQEIKEILK